MIWFKAHHPAISQHKTGSFPVLITPRSLFYLNSLVQFVALLCKIDTVHICRFLAVQEFVKLHISATVTSFVMEKDLKGAKWS